MEITQKAQTPDVHFGSAKQIIYDSSNDSFYSLGVDDGIIYCLTKSNFGNGAKKILDSIEDQITAISFCNEPNTLLVSVKNQLLKITDFLSSKPTISELYSQEQEITGIVVDPQEDSGNITIISEKQATLLNSSGSKIQTIYSDEYDVLWSDIGPLYHTIVLYTSVPGLLSVDGVSGQVKSFESVPNETPKPCFSPSSDLLFVDVNKTGVINIRDFSNNTKSAILLSRHTSPISLITVTPSSKILSADKEGKIIITKYDKKLIKFDKESPSPQPLASTSIINYGDYNLTLLSFGGGAVVAAEEDGKELLWDNVIEDEIIREEKGEDQESDKDDDVQIVQKKITPPKTTKKEKSKPTKPKSSLGMDIAKALMKPVEKKPISLISDDSLTDMDDDAVEIVKQKPAPKLAPKPKPKPKKKTTTTKKKQTKKQDNSDDKFLNDDEIVEYEGTSDDEELESIPPPPPIPQEDNTSYAELKAIEEEEESETSSGHELSEVDENGNRIEKPSTSSEHSETGTANTSDTETDNNDMYSDLTFQFMPNSCPTLSNNRRYLCWNTFGAVYFRSDPESNQDYIDIQPNKRDAFPELNILNLDKYTMGTVNDDGYLLASEHTIEYRMHHPWAPDAGFKREIEDRIELIALGKEWFAIGFSSHTVRLFTTSGLEIYCFEYSHQIISMVGFGDYLLVVYGSDLYFDFFNIKDRNTIAQGRIPGIRPLNWIGFSDQGVPLAYDHEMLLHMLSCDFSNMWIPVADFSTVLDKTMFGYWVIGANNDIAYAYPIKHSKQPPTGRLPHMREFQMSPQTIDLRTSNILKDISDPTEELIIRVSKADQGLMKLLPDALKENKFHLAEDIMECMFTPRARQTAITFADTLGKREFVDKMTGEVTTKKVILPSWQAGSNPIKGIKLTPKKTNSGITPSDKVYVRKDSGDIKGNVITEHSSFVKSLQALTTKTKKKQGFSMLNAPGDKPTPIKKKSTKKSTPAATGAKRGRKKSTDKEKDSTTSVDKFVKK